MTRRVFSPGLRAAVAGLSLVAASCAARIAPLPSGTGAPFPDAASALEQATSQCRGVRTLSAELALSGKAGNSKLRGRLVGGFAERGQVRLEAPAPFGRPVFILVTNGEQATLVLNRAGRVLKNAPPSAIVEALAGVALGPDELRATVAGCGLPSGTATSGQSFPSDWASVQSGETTMWLRRVAGAWQLVASRRGALEIRYADFVSGRPSTIRLRSGDAASPTTDITLKLSQVDINVPLGPEVFQVEVPADAAPITIDELRRSGPLGAGDGDESPAGSR